uniref:Uncharacterized protein n=1 Tax=Podarcis muralis TaxID=64176 RepID=A0A670KL61_PODMU
AAPEASQSQLHYQAGSGRLRRPLPRFLGTDLQIWGHSGDGICPGTDLTDLDVATLGLCVASGSVGVFDAHSPFLQVELYEKKAEALLQLCDFQSAALHLQKAYIVSSHQEDIGCRFAFVFHLQGQCLYEQSAYLDALESFTRASELQPQNKLYRMRSIACLAALKKYNDCLQMVNEEVAQERTNPDLFVLRARLYQCFGKVTFCFHNLQDALELDPEHSEALLMLERLRKEAQKFKEQAVSKAVKGNLKAALLKINRAIEHNPLQADYFLFRGNILRRLRDFDAAIGDYLRAVELSREEDGSEVCVEAQKQVLLTYNDFAVHCYDKGFYEEAVLLLNKAITGEKNEKGLYVNRGDCFLKLGELNFAMADYQQALDLQPFDPSLQKRSAWLYDEMGLQEFRESRYPQAEAYFSQAIENNPRELKYYMHRAKTRLFLQETMGAKEDLITAFLLDPTREEVTRIPSLSQHICRSPAQMIPDRRQSKSQRTVDSPQTETKENDQIFPLGAGNCKLPIVTWKALMGRGKGGTSWVTGHSGYHHNSSLNPSFL